MQITHVTAHNWRNFKNLDVAVADRLLIVGPNAAGKSNLLDLFRFLGDISRKGGGLAAALEARGGLSRARCLFSRNNHKGELAIMVDLRDGEDEWRYELAIKGKKGGHNLPIVVREIVTRNGRELLSRPDANDDRDPDQLTQTHLEQISANREFRPIAEYFAKVNSFHLVPQDDPLPPIGWGEPSGIRQFHDRGHERDTGPHQAGVVPAHRAGPAVGGPRIRNAAAGGGQGGTATPDCRIPQLAQEPVGAERNRLL